MERMSWQRPEAGAKHATVLASKGGPESPFPRIRSALLHKNDVREPEGRRDGASSEEQIFRFQVARSLCGRRRHRCRLWSGAICTQVVHFIEFGKFQE